MFGAKKNNKDKRNHSGKNLAQYGLFDVPNDFNLDGGLDGGIEDEGDSDLEAELAALAGGGSTKPKAPPKRKPIPDADLDSMVAASMKDIPSDEELSGDDDDPDLLNELSNIAGDQMEDEVEEASQPASTQSRDIIKLLNERLKMYEQAEKNAKAAGESSRARRFGRGTKTIKDLIKQANAGRPINNDDIPPEVSTGPRKPPTDTNDSVVQPSAAVLTPLEEPQPEVAVEPEPQPDTPEKLPEVVTPVPSALPIDVSLVNMLIERKNQYKVAALEAKKSGDNATAISYIKIAKQFETVIAAAESGQPVDLSKMPEPPRSLNEKIEINQMQTDSNHEPDNESQDESLITASSVGEALEQRLDVYKKQEESAKEQGNSSKARRMGRIVKQYEQAIKAYKAGKSIAVDELPTPPGYAPIPVEGAAAPTPKPASQRPAPSVPPTVIDKPSPPEKPKAPPKRTLSQTTRITGNQAPNSRADKQLALLLAKQKEFKEAALNAKRKGEIDQAKEYLRTAKGFEPLIDAASCGLPVDLSTLPVSPSAKSQLDNEYDIVMAEECTEDDNSNMDVLLRLENQLTKQLKMCLTTRDHHKALGDVAGTNRFERLALNVTKDLDIIRVARRTSGARIPKFHYENKDFSIVKSFTELGDNDLELTIVRGLQYTCSNPKEIDTYVKFEFPYPQDEPFSQKTSTVKDTNSPEYNATYTIPIQRTARVCQRVFKRQSVKFEVYSKGGFFRGDTLIGTATVKLQPLETKCEVHDSFDLLEGRKKVGGKLEVRLRLRHPIVSQEMEQLHEKWLVIDN